VLFLILTMGILILVYFGALREAEIRNDAEVRSEFKSLVDAYAGGGLTQLNQEVIERSAAPGPISYLLITDGEEVIGDFDRLPDEVKDINGPGLVPVQFSTSTSTEDGEQIVRARGVIGRVLSGPKLLIARDYTEARDVADRMFATLVIAGLSSAVLSILAGALAGYHAASRVSQLTKAARAASDGDLTQRVPMSGWQDEFDRLARQLNEMLDRLERQEAATRGAGDAIAHDMRSPLTRLRSRLEEGLRSAQPDMESQREALRAALEETESVLKTFNAIFQLSQLTSSDHLNAQRVVVTALVDEIFETYLPVAEDHHITLTAEIARGLVIFGDAQLVMQAIANLMDNALKFTPSGGRIEIGLRSRPDDFNEIRISDSGPGIPPEDRERVKGRFVRLDATRNSPGAGLGLSLVNAVTELHRGRMFLDDGIDAGAGPGLTVRLLLPAAPR
jgi:signal transduction histidine kinase